jgi:hypothetical protein
MQKIIYIQDSGNAAVITPTPETLAQYGIEAVAQKDVPAGKPYKILDASELPFAPQETWIVDESQLNDGVGAGTDEFPAL